MTYSHKKESDHFQILRDDVHVASYDPVTEAVTYTEPDNERFAGPVAKEIRLILEESKQKNETPNRDTGGQTGPPSSDPLPPNTNFAEATQEVRELAGVLYTAYSAAVGGKAFNGDTLPGWDEFSKDAGKTLQSNAWLAATSAGLESLSEGANKSSAELKRKVKAQEIEIVHMRDELKKSQGSRSPLAPRTPERFDDPFDDTAAPDQDPGLGDLTPAYIDWARKNMPKELFHKRYHNRIALV